MAVNINGNTGIDKIQTGAVESSDLTDNSIGADKLNVTGNGTSGQVLSSDGDGSMTWTTLAAGGGFSNIQVFTSSGTWTNPGTVDKVKVTVVAGGGSGGAGAGGVPQHGGGGGGAGGAAIEVISFPTSTNVPVTVGNGGAARATPYSYTGTNGNNGGTSSFGSYCSATGGEAGRGVNQPNAYGDGGNGSGGNINIQGGDGDLHENVDHNGRGGNSIMGSGGAISTTDSAFVGLAGRGYGSGGAGGAYVPVHGPRNSGAGKAGIVIVEY